MDCRCLVCGKSFTGTICYKQHEASEKHKKNVYFHQLKTSVADTAVSYPSEAQNEIHCSVCNVSFITVQSFKMHAVSLEHSRKVMEGSKYFSTEASMSMSDCTTNDTSNTLMSDSTTIDSSNTSCSTDSTFRNETSATEQINCFLQPKYQYATAPYDCKICKKTFTGPEPYKQHIESAAHKKKITVTSSVAAGGTDDLNTMVNELKCEICCKNFSGPLPLDQHLKSEVHRKKVHQAQLRANLTDSPFPIMNEADSSSQPTENLDSTVSKLWYCTICKKQSTGPIPFKQHLEGESHRKNLHRAELRMDQVCEEKHNEVLSNNNGIGYTSPSTLEMSFPIKQIELSKIKTVDQQNSNSADNDYIFPNLQNFKILQYNDLNLKYFQPDEKIEFKCDSEKEVPLENVTVDFKQTQNKSEIYQICDICNVTLWTKEECLSHYDSKEHFMKKWY